MLMQILIHTPRWVFFLFAALLALGLSQLAGRHMTLRRITVLPLVMLGLSLWGTIAAFSGQPAVLMAWLAAGAATFMLVQSQPVPAGTAYDAASRRFAVPGSAWPLVLMMAIFATKYGVGITLAFETSLAMNAVFGTTVAAVYGALSGIFLGRAARLWKLALPTISQAPGFTPAA